MNEIKFNGEVSQMSGDWFAAEIAKVPAKGKAVIHLNTPGGDIYAGNHMINAIEDAMRERGCKFQVVVGAIAASMGASLVAAVKAQGGEIVAHRNSELMFHGCWGITVGGADEHTDSAKQMKDFNEGVIANLEKLGVKECRDWFVADREMWMTAEEAKGYGLVDSILGEDADAEDGVSKDCAHKLAAKLNHADAPAAEATVSATAPAADPDDPKDTKDESFKARYQGASKKINELQAKLDALKDVEAKNAELVSANDQLNNQLEQSKKDLADAQASVSDLTAKLDKSNADLVAARKDLADSKEQVAALEQARQLLTAGVLTPGSDKGFDEQLKAAKSPEERMAIREKMRKAKSTK